MNDQPQPPREQGTDAEERFLEAVLRERYRSRAAEVDQAVRRAMSGLSSGGVERGRRWAPWSLVAAAAAVVVFLLVFVGPDRAAPDARAMIDRALQSALADVDRRYRVEVEDPRSPEPMELSLDVRGGNCFRVEVDRGPRAGSQVGSDGTQFWLIPHQSMLPAFEGNVPARLRDWLQLGGVELPLLQVSKVLERLGEGYDLEVSDDAASGQHRILATAREGVAGPKDIELDVRDSDGVVVDIQMWWGEADDGHMRILWQDEQPRSPDWYQLSTHVGSRAVVNFEEPRGERR